MEYIELEIKISPLDPFREYMSYHLAEIGFDMFTDTESGLLAYSPSDAYNENSVNQIINDGIELGCIVSYNSKIIPWQNWNEEWEKAYQPEVIAGKIYVRADFHPENKSYPLEIIIQPRMAFGTGHHPTTSQVMEMMLKMDFKGKKIIDMGCGTGILAVLAMKLNAEHAVAIDNDTNAVENSVDNVLKNNCKNIEVFEGEADALKGLKCDIFIANINRNIILNDLALYKETMTKGGELITSGYYLQDLAIITKKAKELGFEFIENTVQNDWCCARFLLASSF
jgi:ribosomal protein L11 methyltransferase